MCGKGLHELVNASGMSAIVRGIVFGCGIIQCPVFFVVFWIIVFFVEILMVTCVTTLIVALIADLVAGLVAALAIVLRRWGFNNQLRI